MKDRLTKEVMTSLSSYRQTRSVATQWREPLVGFADAEDPLFERMKQVVSPWHARPRDLLPDARTVIAYFLPFDKPIPKTNRPGYYASRSWAIAYIETNRMIVALNKRLSRVLREEGFQTAIVPPTHHFDKDRLISDWSHKHVAYIAGLGKFGLHNLLITDKGCCGRLGSLITNARVEVTPCPDTEYCLFKYNQTCGACVMRCSYGALSRQALDRHRCYEILLENDGIYRAEGLADVCGKCSSGVPCSFRNPVARAQRAMRSKRELRVWATLDVNACSSYRTEALHSFVAGNSRSDLRSILKAHPKELVQNEDHEEKSIEQNGETGDQYLDF